MKTMSIALICLMVLLCGKFAFASDDIVVFTFKDNRQQRVRLIESECNIKSISFESGSSTTSSSGTPTTTTVSAVNKNPCTIKVVSAKYGVNCNANYEVVRVARDCDGKTECHGTINNDYAGFDPAPGCGKDFTVSYLCGNTSFKEHVSGKLGEGGSWSLKCNCGDGTPASTPSSRTLGSVFGKSSGTSSGSSSGTSSNTPAAASSAIRVISAKYGANCKANYNVGRLAGDCNGRAKCTGIIDNDYAGTDPAPGCFKDFTIRYECGNISKSFYVPARQDEGGRWTIECP